MAKARRAFARRVGSRRIKKLFVVATEGAKTEKQYFRNFGGANSVVQVKCITKKHGNSPAHLLKNMKRSLGTQNIEDSDEAWIVVDRDQWEQRELDQLSKWANSRKNYGLGMSNPNFEFWLLMHFEDGKGVTIANCISRLRKYIKDYNKDISRVKFTPEMLNKAIHRAKIFDTPCCCGWPRKIGSTTVYRLVENILNT